MNATDRGVWHGFSTRGHRLETDATQGLKKGNAEADPPELRFIREFREAYSRSPLIRERLARRFRRAGFGGLEAGRLRLVRPRAAEGGAVSGRKLLCFMHLRSFRALDPRRRNRFIYPGIRG